MPPVPVMKREARPFNGEMIAAVRARKLVAGHVFQVLRLESFEGREADAVQCQFWLGTRRAESATYTFTCTSDLSVAENLAELEDFVRDRFLVASKPPVAEGHLQTS